MARRLVLTFLRASGVSMTADRVVQDMADITDAGPSVIDVPTTGRLLVDMNGTATCGRIELAVLSGAPILGSGDFIF